MKPLNHQPGVLKTESDGAHSRQTLLSRRDALGRSGWVLSGGLVTLTGLGRDALAASNPVSPKGAIPWPVRQPTPDLKLVDGSGRLWDLSERKGQLTLVHFWASWCEPCLTELPSLEWLADRHAAKGLVVLAVNFRETDARLRRFLQTTPIDLTILRDRDGAAAQAWGVRMFPTSIVVDASGRARWVLRGEQDWASPPIEQWIQQFF